MHFMNVKFHEEMELGSTPSQNSLSVGSGGRSVSAGDLCLPKDTSITSEQTIRHLAAPTSCNNRLLVYCSNSS